MIEQKRLTVQKCRISDIVLGRYVSLDGFNPNYVLTADGRKLFRVHVLATAINTYVSDDEKYAFVVLDDATAMIRVKIFQDTKPVQKIKKGDLVDIIGRIRQYNSEIHISPEIVKILSDPNSETLRKIEIVQILMKQRSKNELVLAEAKKHKDIEDLKKDFQNQDIKAEDVETVLNAESIKEEKNEKESVETDMRVVKSLVIKSTEELDTGDGAEYTKIIEKVGLPESVCESAITELLSEGSCYEPRAGRIKVL